MANNNEITKNSVTDSYTAESLRDLVLDAPECLRERKVYRERGHVLAVIGGMEVGRAEIDSVVDGVSKADIAILRDTRNGLPVGAIVRQPCVGGTTATMELWNPLFLERTRGKTIGQADAYRQYYKSLHDPAFVASEIIALYGRQTEDEQKCKDTIHLNNKGFCAFSGKAGARLAETVLAGKTLEGDDLCRAVAICLRHRRQVLEGR